MPFCTRCGRENAADVQFCPACGSAMNAANATPPAPGAGIVQTGTGLQKNVAGLLCYVVGWITGIIFFVIEKDRFVRFHAMQSIITFGALSILQILLTWMLGAFLWRVLFLYSLLNMVLGLGTLGLWILLMVKAYQGQTYKLPIVGDLAEKYCA